MAYLVDVVSRIPPGRWWLLRRAMQAEGRARDAAAFLTAGLLFERGGDPEAAARCYGRAVEFEPHDAIAQWLLGFVLEREGKPHEAIVAYGRALEYGDDLAAAFRQELLLRITAMQQATER